MLVFLPGYNVLIWDIFRIRFCSTSTNLPRTSCEGIPLGCFHLAICKPILSALMDTRYYDDVKDSMESRSETREIVRQPILRHSALVKGQYLDFASQHKGGEETRLYVLRVFKLGGAI